MEAELAQRIALVAYGNAFLSGLIDRPPDLLTDNSAFQHARSVEFRASERSIHRVDLWFSALAKRGAKRLWVRRDDIGAEGADLREVWLSSAVFISKSFEMRQDRQVQVLAETGVWNDEEGRAISSVVARTERPWRLFFTQEQRKSRLTQGMPLPVARSALVEAIEEARGLSRRHGMGFVGAFGKAFALLRSPRPAAPYHPDMLPPVGYPLDARRVLAAATQAWVFGAWGWGDRVFESDAIEAEFWRIDAKLQASVQSALIAATNAFDGSQA